MNIKLIFGLSMFGLAMAILTVFVLPSAKEWMGWVPIFLLCAFLIGKNAGSKYFLHGLLLGIFNCVWITGFHAVFHERYLTLNPAMAQMADMPVKGNVALNMLITGPIVGIISGVVIGLFSIIASKLVKK